EFVQAAELAREAAAIEDGPHGPNAVQFFAVQRVALALERGAEAGLVEIAEPLRMLAERYPTLPVWRSAFARVCAELGRHTEARRDLDLLAADDFAAVPREGNWLPAMMNLGETAVLLEDRARAARLYHLLRPYAGLHVVVAHGAACFGSVERYLGRLAAASRPPGAAVGRGRAPALALPAHRRDVGDRPRGRARAAPSRTRLRAPPRPARASGLRLPGGRARGAPGRDGGLGRRLGRARPRRARPAGVRGAARRPPERARGGAHAPRPRSPRVARGGDRLARDHRHPGDGPRRARTAHGLGRRARAHG